jgi:RNase H-fold protein (predicted Holliday junction resolvase)
MEEIENILEQAETEVIVVGFPVNLCGVCKEYTPILLI